MQATDRSSTSQSALRVSILARSDYLIASIHTVLDDTQMQRFQHDMVDQIGQRRAAGAVIGVAALDVIDSYACNALRRIGQAARLRGARTVVVGARPEVALALVQLGTSLDPVDTALDLEEGLELLHRHSPGDAR